MQVPSSRVDREKDPSSSYTRTLVGPLSANAARLYDDKKQVGIFFTFQDLSVRTEGPSYVQTTWHSAQKHLRYRNIQTKA